MQMKISTWKKNAQGFTLIELLVVIAIIGILSAVVLSSVNIARAKARDAQRLAQMKEIRSALDIFYETNQTYPSSTPTGFTGDDAALQFLASAVDGNFYLSKVPTPVGGGGATYIYHGVKEDGSECTLGGEVCTSYVAGIQIERAENPSLIDDADMNLASVFFGGSSDCKNNSGTDLCFDIHP
jgi:prepilin-type N-terminal cleavage/methylation domain-containing protein